MGDRRHHRDAAGGGYAANVGRAYVEEDKAFCDGERATCWCVSKSVRSIVLEVLAAEGLDKGGAVEGAPW